MTPSDAWTLRELLARCGHIDIPMIQRDYAQGRTDARTVGIRSGLVAALASALADGAPPLDLDFVYGSWDETKGLAPLDGQQRLTTLLLLHWVLACRDAELADLQSWILHRDEPRFTYRTRVSAGEFLAALLRDKAAPDVESGVALSRQVEDRQWFFKAWKHDPTVSSCLVMLDALQARFQGPEGSGRYRRLVSADAPIVFRLLRLSDFKLSDDLYIKMNARGKPLTSFEIFKAQLERRVDEAFAGEPGPPRLGTWRHYVGTQFDTAWSNFFWAERNTKTNAIDPAIMGFIRAAAVVTAVEEEAPDADARDLLARVVGFLGATEHTVDAYAQRGGAFFRALVRNLSALLDTLSATTAAPILARTDYYPERAALRRVCAARDAREADGLTLVDWLKFYGYAAFLLAPRERWPIASLHDWMRLVVNLAENSELVDEERLVRGLRAVRTILRETDGASLLQYVAEGRAAAGFSRQQLREERLKAQLILRPSTWRPLIEAAEIHPYFRGEIEFLFQFAGVLGRWIPGCAADWTEAEDTAFRNAFAVTYARVCAIFPVNGAVRSFLRPFRDALWERALLCEGDYTLQKASNRSFLDESDRDASWKRLLRADMGDAIRAARRDVAGRVIAAVDPADPEGSLRAVVEKGVVGDAEGAFPGWRGLLVARPELITYCHKRQFRPVSNSALYLLRGVTRGGEHRELHTYALYLTVKDACAPFESAHYEAVWTDSVQPALVFTKGMERVRVETVGADFCLVRPSLVPAFEPTRTRVPRTASVAEILAAAAGMIGG